VLDSLSSLLGSVRMLGRLDLKEDPTAHKLFKKKIHETASMSGGGKKIGSTPEEQGGYKKRSRSGAAGIGD